MKFLQARGVCLANREMCRAPMVVLSVTEAVGGGSVL